MHDEPTRREGLVLSSVAGAVDGIGYVLLHVFTAHITGNTVHLGAEVGRLDLSGAARPAFAIAAFLVGVGLGAAAREVSTQHGMPERVVVFALCGSLLAVFLALGEAVADAAPTAARFYALAAPAALAMGCQNAVMPRVGGRRVRTYITGTMTEFVEAVVAAARASPSRRADSVERASDLCAVWLAYLVGGIVSGAAGVRWGVATALFPIAGLAIAIGMEVHRRHAREIRTTRVLR
jgi:uncharacterized membrane protein YoaK (UPF0700 family)